MQTPGDPSISYDPSSISPSAYALLLMKRHTAIPYAREAAALINTQGIDVPDLSGNDPTRYAAFLLHFEGRYWSIDQLLADLTMTNMLELSSGFSFRGLDLTRRKPVYYIDTDLPGLIAVKQPMIDRLLAQAQTPAATSAPAPETPQAPKSASTPEPAQAPASPQAPPAPGHYELQPLDVLDADAFAATVARSSSERRSSLLLDRNLRSARFPPGPLAIVNEGLLMYLDIPQKERLCEIIRKTLADRGGCWITADIYTRDPTVNDTGSGTGSTTAGTPPADHSTPWGQWRTQHHIEENKFQDFAEARAFFTRMGFKIDKEAKPDYTRLTSLPFLRTTAGPQILESLRQSGRIRFRATWRLTIQP